MRSHSQDRLHDFLRAARQEGVLDSQGVFTLNQQRAAGKLASSLLPSGGYWALKVLQAACLAQARSMALRETGSSLTLQLELPQPLQHAELVNQLLTPSLEAGWLAQLSQGIRGLGSERAWLVQLQSQGRTTQLGNDQGNLSAETVDHCAYRGAGARLQLWAEPGRRGEREVELLSARGVASSTPLTINGERVDHLQFAPSNERANVLPVGVHWAVGGHRNGLLIPPGVREPQRWNYVPAFTPQSRVNRMIAVHYHYIWVLGGTEVRGLPAESSLHMVRHGVIVHTTPLRIYHPISVDLFLFADDDQVDLSGLTARLPKDNLGQSEEEVTAFNASLRDLGRQLNLGRFRPGRSQLLAWGGAGALALGTLPVLTLLWGLGLARWYLRHEAHYRKLRSRASDALESYRRELPIVIRRR